jgi:hypothetical protein
MLSDVRVSHSELHPRRLGTLGARPTGFSLWRLLSLAAVLALFTASPARAMTVVPPSFSTLVAQSTQILRVEVTATSSRWDTTPKAKVIHTYVQCSVLRTLKGDTASSITLRFLGGQVGDDHMELPGQPVLEVAHTYIIFVAKNGDAFCPIVAGSHGLYPIGTDANTQSETVLRANLQPLTSVDGVSEPMTSTLQPQSVATTGISREAFEDFIVGEANRASTH